MLMGSFGIDTLVMRVKLYSQGLTELIRFDNLMVKKLTLESEKYDQST